MSMATLQVDLSLIYLGLLLAATYLLGVPLYRVYLSPLANVPGPRLAAATYLYEFFYDGMQKGRFLWKIQELHAKYGPIVRINPGEVHINDIHFYDRIYASGSQHPRNKIRFMATHDESTFDTYDAEQHRARRSAMAASFSKQSIRSLEPTIRHTVERLMNRMHNFANTGAVVNLKQMYSGLTLEVIAGYCFGESMVNMKQEQFGPDLLDAFNALPQGHPLGRMFPWLFDLVSKIPARFIATVDAKFRPLAEYEAKIDGQLAEVLAKDKPDGLRTVFHEIRDSKLPDPDKTISRFKSEAAIFLGAGTETTASALTVMSFFLTQNQDMLLRLRKEISGLKEKKASAEALTVAELETLPFLTALIQESVRLSFGVPGRLPRIAPQEVLVYSGHRLPSGTVMSSSSYLLHTDPNIYPEPFAFKPERWLGNKNGLAGNFVPFGRGSRMCIGINLAYAEMYLTSAAMFTAFDFDLFETTRKDVDIAHDFFVGFPPLKSKGVRVTVSRHD
ncbi:Cytochrome-P450 monooxygenase [Teratosphaeria destructans]|uniref:Cytochrome-P450 monooxygenase n=1 Tax=Teratosphaeria destructans TaxID=418781 RepID=A0A9W7SZG5_9PEZI|nr:Cytochrome-P450 monooxygenase [Teratosphaeria destructans]